MNRMTAKGVVSSELISKDDAANMDTADDCKIANTSVEQDADTGNLDTSTSKGKSKKRKRKSDCEEKDRKTKCKK